jgi:hypothetical protein
MGCDIHFYVERRVKGRWVSVDKWTPLTKKDIEEYKEYLDSEIPKYRLGYKDSFYSGRNYDLFAILANVRNGVGFAGIPTGLGFVPIAMPRGLPKNVSKKVKIWSDIYGEDGHSHSYLTLKELLDYDWNQTTVEYGVVGPNGYKEYKEKGYPTEYSSGVWGKDIEYVSEDEMENLIKNGLQDTGWDNKVFTKLAWKMSYRDCAGDFIKETIPKLEKLDKNSKNVRIVFWFDN